MALHVTARGQRHGHRSQHYRQQRRKTEEFLCPVERRTNLRTGILRILDTLAPFQSFLNPRTQLIDYLPLAGQQQAISHPAARLNQSRRLKIGQVHQQARHHAEKIHPAIRFQRQDGGNPQGLLPDGQRIAHTSRKRRSQPFVDPDCSRWRNATRRRIGRIAPRCNTQAPAQRVALRHRLDFDQLRAQAIALPQTHHARKGTRFDHRQAPRPRLIRHLGIPRMIGNQQEIRPQQLIGLLLQRLAHPIGKETHRRQRCHRHHQRRYQQTQLPRPRVAA